MKLRSLVLLSCMLLVPSLAMFSHLIPADFRASMRRRFASAMNAWLDSSAAVAAAAEPLSPSTAASPVAEQTHARTSTPNLPSPATGPMAVVAGPASTAGQPLPGGKPAADSPNLAAPADARGNDRGAGAASPADPVPPPQVAQLADRTRQVRDQQARDQRAIESQLEALGAVSFDCLPPTGPDGLHVSSCRVPVDATGQLQRVFQANGHDPGSASAALLEQVLAWRQRAALQPPRTAAAPGDAAAPFPSDRFR